MKKIVLLSLLFITTVVFSQNKAFKGESSAIKEVKVFPNPATNVINILGLQNSSKAQIVISDTYGNTLMSYQWEIKNNALNIPIANLDSGIYFISIRTPEQHIQKKFLKK